MFHDNSVFAQAGQNRKEERIWGMCESGDMVELVNFIIYKENYVYFINQPDSFYTQPHLYTNQF